MGFRLHIAQIYHVAWDKGSFNHLQSEVEDLFRDLPGVEVGFSDFDGNGEPLRIVIDTTTENLAAVSKEIHRLRQSPNECHYCFNKADDDPVVTNGDVADFLEKMLNTSDKSHSRIEMRWC